MWASNRGRVVINESVYWLLYGGMISCYIFYLFYWVFFISLMHLSKYLKEEESCFGVGTMTQQVGLRDKPEVPRAALLQT